MYASGVAAAYPEYMLLFWFRAAVFASFVFVQNQSTHLHCIWVSNEKMELISAFLLVPCEFMGNKKGEMYFAPISLMLQRNSAVG